MKNNNKNNLYILGIIAAIIILILVIIFLFDPFKKTNKSNPNNNHNDNKDNNEIIEKDQVPTEEELKLRELNNINEKLDFFNMDYIDRYIDYKNNNSTLDLEKVIVYVNIGLDKKKFTDSQSSPYKYTNEVLANKLYYLGEDYVPKNLQEIDNKYANSSGKYLEKDAKDAFEELAKDAQKEGYKIIATSTYRSYNYQKNLYNNYAKQDGVEKADTYSARAGYSEHQTGYAVDVSNGGSYTQFGDTKEFTWMKENAYKYGFILRYTKETEFITGYMNEPWHYRYVGKEIAKYIQENPMTYEEYYVRFLENKKSN